MGGGDHDVTAPHVGESPDFSDFGPFGTCRIVHADRFRKHVSLAGQRPRKK